MQVAEQGAGLPPREQPGIGVGVQGFHAWPDRRPLAHAPGAGHLGGHRDRLGLAGMDELGHGCGQLHPRRQGLRVGARAVHLDDDVVSNDDERLGVRRAATRVRVHPQTDEPTCGALGP